MEYTILIYESEAAFSSRTDERAEGSLLGRLPRLHPGPAGRRDHGGRRRTAAAALATTVRQRDGKRQVQDGPYAETKEQLGGFYIIDVPDLDAALDWAARCPAGRERRRRGAARPVDATHELRTHGRASTPAGGSRRAAQLLRQAASPILAARSRDVAAAEDALADAFAAALADLAARRRARQAGGLAATGGAAPRSIDAAPARAIRDEAAPTCAPRRGGRGRRPRRDDAIFPTSGCKLLFVCAHPAIDAAMRAPLMLQTVLGLDAARIASAFLVRARAMGQRLVARQDQDPRRRHPRSRCPSARAAARASTRCWRRSTPPTAAAGTTWPAPRSAAARPGRGGDLARPARRSAAAGRARGARPARADAPLRGAARSAPRRRRRLRAARGAGRRALGAADDRRGRALLLAPRGCRRASAASSSRPRSSRRTRSARTGTTDWEAIALLYEARAPRADRRRLVGRAAALAKRAAPAAALAALDALPPAAVAGYQPYWALRAHLLAVLDRPDEAAQAYTRAIDLSADEAARAFLAAKEGALWRS